jgi:citrate/tricarballylate utilization protein
MPRIDLLQEAERQMTICNACRYCEGYCAVFPAIELRTTFKAGDLVYLANLCHECRACFYACQYAPPHQFAVNIPQVLTEIRNESYGEYSWPRVLTDLRSSPTAAAALVLSCLVAIAGLVLAWQGPAALLTAQTGEGAFYRVVPYVAMVAPALLIAGYAVALFAAGAQRFWRDTRSSASGPLTLATLTTAARDALALRYMSGGGDGCNYPTERFSQSRRWFHHLTYYGFVLDLASTTVAAIFDHLLGWHAPYPLLSLPVVLGTIGGVMLMVGTAGLLWLKFQSDPAPGTAVMRRMDTIFLAMLFATALTGMLLLVVRDTPAMPSLLVVHLAVVAALFLSLPYGKFVHAVFRSAALVRNATEQTRHS